MSLKNEVLVATTKKKIRHFCNKNAIYNNSTSIKCPSLKVAQVLADHLNRHNEQSLGIFKLNEGEIWHFYEVGNWENPRYKLASVKGKISIRENI